MLCHFFAGPTVGATRPGWKLAARVTPAAASGSLTAFAGDGAIQDATTSAAIHRPGLTHAGGICMGRTMSGVDYYLVIVENYSKML
jgi:hypothetical protein